MTSRQNSTSILEGYPHDTASEISCDAQFVCNSRCTQIAWRHLSVLAILSSYCLHALILGAVHGLTIIVKVIAGNTMQARHATRINSRVTNGCNRRQVVNASIVAVEALIKQTTETRLTKSAIKTIQILPAHLVHNHTHHEARATKVLSFLR